MTENPDKAFRLVLADGDLLKNSIPIIAEIIDEGMFTVDKNGVTLLAPERTMVSVVDFHLLSSAFDEYNVTSPEQFGVNMANFAAILKRASSSDKIIMESGKESKLKITLQGNGKRVFEIPFIDIKSEKPPVDQLNFPTKLELQARVIEDGLADAEIISDSVVLNAVDKTFKMWAKGDVSSSHLEIKDENEGLLSFTSEQESKSQYPLDYLKKMMKANKISSQILLEFGTDYPMRITFKAIDKLNLRFILAPRVSDD